MSALKIRKRGGRYPWRVYRVFKGVTESPLSGFATHGEAVEYANLCVRHWRTGQFLRIAGVV